MAVLRPERAGGAVAFAVERMGEALRARLGRSLEGERIVADGEDLLGSMAAAHGRCLSTLAPSHDWAPLRLGDGTRRLERLVLPFSSDGTRITHLVGIVALEGTT